MEYIISDTSIIRINETSGVIQNNSNSKIELSNKESFSEKYLLKPNNEVSFNGSVYARAYRKVSGVIKFNVVSFIAWSGGSGGGTDEPDDNVPDYLDDLLSGGDDGYDNADTTDYINDMFNGNGDNYDNPDTNEYFNNLLNG